MEDQLQTIIKSVEQLNIKFDSILEDIKYMKEKNDKFDQSIQRLENDIKVIDDLDKKLDTIKELQNNMKKDTQRMDDHITYVETSMTNLKECLSFRTPDLLKSLSPFKAITLLNPFKSIEQNNEEYLIREINKDEVKIETKKS